MNVEPVIRVREFSFALDGKPILREVSFDVARGQYVAIIGPNGAGKTTLLKCLDRILVGGSGQIEIMGRPLERYGQKELARRISYVPQADGRVLPFTVAEFVALGRFPHLSPFAALGRDDRRAINAAIEQTGMSDFAARRLDTLSGGERQKAFIAAALAQGAEILLLDEPTTFLDYRCQAEVRGLLREANRASGVTIVAVTHDVNAAALEADAAIALREGRVVFCGPPRELMQPEPLQRIYATPLLLVAHPAADVPVIVPEAPGGGA